MRAIVLRTVLLVGVTASASAARAAEQDGPPPTAEAAQASDAPAATAATEETPAPLPEASSEPVTTKEVHAPQQPPAPPKPAAPAPSSSGWAVLGATLGGAVGLVFAVPASGVVFIGLAAILAATIGPSGAIPELIVAPIVSSIFPAALAGAGAWLGGAGTLGIVLAGVGAGALYAIGTIGGVFAGYAIGSGVAVGGYGSIIAGLVLGAGLGAVVGSCGGAALGALAGEVLGGATVE